MSARLCYHESGIIGYKYLISSASDKNFLCFITKNECPGFLIVSGAERNSYG